MVGRRVIEEMRDTRTDDEGQVDIHSWSVV